MAFNTLPTEVHLNVLPYLDPVSFRRLSLTNHHFRELRKSSLALCQEMYHCIEGGRSHGSTHMTWFKNGPAPMLCYSCFELHESLNPQEHYYLSNFSNYAPARSCTRERMCVSCDKKYSGYYLTKILVERSENSTPRSTVAMLLQEYPEEARILLRIPLVIDELLRYGPKPAGKQYLERGDIEKWDDDQLKDVLHKMVWGEGYKRLKSAGIICTTSGKKRQAEEAPVEEAQKKPKVQEEEH